MVGVIFGVSSIIGLLIGSFLSVVITRYGTDETIIYGRSRCGQCKKVIAWYDNIPLIGYVMLRGRCRHCRGVISIFYPMVEVVTAITFLVITYFFYSNTGSVFLDIKNMVHLLLALAIATGLIVIFFYDLRTMHIPMNIAWGTVVLVLLYKSIVYLYSGGDIHNVILALVGGFCGYAFLFLLSALSRERWMGAGDAYIGLIGGLITAWPAVVFFLTVAFGIGAVVGIVLIISGLRSRKDAVPFAPFLIVAIAITIAFPMLFPALALHIPYF